MKKIIAFVSIVMIVFVVITGCGAQKSTGTADTDKESKLALGHFFVAAVNENGTVNYIGINDWKSEAKYWKNISQITCSGDTFGGLKKDGTVLSLDRYDKQKECVKSW
ncbi:MAG: hypothetical protein RR797_04005, partial [Christensenella sp.]